jgi:flagellar biosynthetic protein FliR
MAIFNFPIEQVQLFVFVLVRVAAILFSIPFLDSQSIPSMVKTGLAIAVTILVIPHVTIMPPSLLDKPVQLIMGLAVETAVGLMIGLIVQLLFMGVQLAGQIIGYQMGIAIANVVDPASSLQIPVLGQFLNIFAMMLFLSLNVHLYFVKALADAFQRIPLWGFHFNRDLFDLIMMFSSNAFVVAVQVAAPVMVALLLTSFALGLIARTVPQMQVFTLSMPINILLGLFILGISLPFFNSYMHSAFVYLGKTIQALIGWLS